MHSSVYAISSVIVVSLISFVGIFTISLHTRWGDRLLRLLVSFAAGALLGDVFIHLLPEIAEKGQLDLQISIIILGSIILFFIAERFLHWHHHHDESEATKVQYHPVVFLNLFGDGLHNLIDGLIIGGSYMVDVKLGLATTLAVILHEIPQEFGDFAILIYGGLSKRKALFYNFLSALTALAGVLIALTFKTSDNFANVLVALGIGSFTYIAVADLIPEIQKSKSAIWPQIFAMLLGIGIMFALLFIE